MKPFILCADDYGLHPSINEAILELIQLGRLNATSCIVNTGHWSENALLLKPYAHKVQIGLHFNLTENEPITELPALCYGSLNRLITCSHLRLLSQRKVEKEFEAQLDRFINVIGKAPDFIDGHQYVHQFPIIRRALLDVYQRRFKHSKPYIRVPANSFWNILQQGIKNPKQLFVAVTGAFALRRLLKQLHIPYNTSFSGIYNFSTKQPFAILFNQFVKEVKNNGLIVCHPAKPSISRANSLDKARVQEYLFLKQMSV